MPVTKMGLGSESDDYFCIIKWVVKNDDWNL